MIDYPVERIDNHREQAIDRFTSQYFEAEKLRNLTGAFVDRYQGLEDAVQQLLRERWVDDAVGQQLDELGAIVGEPRLNRRDEVYRPAIRLRIILNRAGGEPESLIRFVRLAFDAEVVAYTEIYPAKVEIYARVGAEGAGEIFTINQFELNDGNLLELDDGSTLDVLVSSRELFESQVDRIREIMPAGVGTLFFVESGQDIAFGTTEIVEEQSLVTDQGEEIELSDGSTLAVFDFSEIDEAPDYIAGLGELGVADFELQLSDDFILELDDGSTFGVTDQIDYIEGTAPRGVVGELFEVE